MEKIIYFGVIVICLAVFIVIFSRLLKEFGKQLNLAKTISVKVSCAGSAVADAPNEVKVQLNCRKFYDKNNNLVNPNDYDKFLVKGWSMLLCGIKNNDLLFTRKIQSLDDVVFDRPHVYVLKRDEYVRNKVAIKNDRAEFKVRRAWAIVCIGKDDLMESIKKIVSSEFFVELKHKHPNSFLTEDEMLKDFNDERIEQYMEQYPDSMNESDKNHVAIISTTLKASKENKVTFSIHPARTIVGEVVYSYKI